MHVCVCVCVTLYITILAGACRRARRTLLLLLCRYQIYLLYLCKSTNTDAKGASTAPLQMTRRPTPTRPRSTSRFCVTRFVTRSSKEASPNLLPMRLRRHPHQRRHHPRRQRTPGSSSPTSMAAATSTTSPRELQSRRSPRSRANWLPQRVRVCLGSRATSSRRRPRRRSILACSLREFWRRILIGTARLIGVCASRKQAGGGPRVSSPLFREEEEEEEGQERGRMTCEGGVSQRSSRMPVSQTVTLITTTETPALEEAGWGGVTLSGAL